MATTPVTPAPKPTFAQEFESITNILLVLGGLAASIFVKNPAHKAQATNVMTAVTTALGYIDSQLTPPTP